MAKAKKAPDLDYLKKKHADLNREIDEAESGKGSMTQEELHRKKHQRCQLKTRIANLEARQAKAA